MRAGRLREIITFDEPVSAMGSWNDEILSFVPAIVGIRAAIEPLRGNENLNNGQITAELTTKIITRWSRNLARVTEKWRIRCYDPVLDKDVIYNIGQPPIQSLLNHREITFLCKSGVNQG